MRSTPSRHAGELARVLRPFFGAQPRALRRGALLAATTVLAGMALLGLSGWFITATAIAGLHAATAFAFDVFAPSAGIRLLALGRTASRYGERLVTHDATFGALAVLRVRLFRAWARAGAARQLALRPSRLLFRLTSDIDALESLYLRLLVPAAAALGAALLAGAVLGMMHVAMGIALAAWLLAAGWGIAFAVSRRARRPALRRARAIETLRARAADLVAGQTELATTGRLDAQCASLRAADERLSRADLALNRLESAAGMAYGGAGTLTLVAVLLAVAVLVERGSIGAPAAALALLAALTALEPFAALRRGALESGRTWLAVRRLAPAMNDESAPAPSSAPGAALAVRLADVDAVHRGASAPALAKLSLEIAAGERVAIVGASGSGKSTLLSLIAGELAPCRGEVAADGACLFTQRTELFEDTLRDNLRLADPGANDERLWDALHEAGLADDVRRLAAGLDTRLGEGGLGLSGGQARRLALARLFLRPVPLWLLDEPTESLDAAVAHDVLRRIATGAEGRTLVIATHLRREAALADRLLCIAHGRVVADLRRGSTHFDAALGQLRAD